jgi:hypothetical protein
MRKIYNSNKSKSLPILKTGKSTQMYLKAYEKIPFQVSQENANRLSTSQGMYKLYFLNQMITLITLDVFSVLFKI